MSSPVFRLGNRELGVGRPCLIVAEISANHNQDLDRALAIVRAARQAGADAVKLQTYTPDTLTIDCDNEWFRIPDGSLWQGRTLHQLYSEAFTPWAWHAELFRVAREEGLLCFSTPFDETAVALLEALDSPAHKVASFEIIDTPLLETIGKTGTPVILSTGMATISEIREAVNTLRAAGSTDIALLKCTSAYPAPPESMNVRAIGHLRELFEVPVGLSDHTLTNVSAVAAVAMGAVIVEKHLTLDRSAGGPDAAFSLEPDEFAALVADIREAEKVLGSGTLAPVPEETQNIAFRRSLFVVQDIEEGQQLTTINVRSIRPGHGLAPRHFKDVIGRTVTRRVSRGTPLTWDLVDG